MSEDPNAADLIKKMVEARSPDEIVANARSSFLDVQLRALLQMRFPQVSLTYDILLALSRERPMHDLLFACFLMIENIFKMAGTPALDREINYRILGEVCQDIIRQMKNPPAPPAPAPTPEKPPE